jgi:lysyl-tRNA synthetase class 2
MIKRRSNFWNTIRSFLLQRDFIEVETPTLETTTGGADARPFVTHHNALDIDVYLRISAGELWQKRLMVAGLPKTFEIGRIFRNEGMSPEHAQDYTQLEFYEAYSDFSKGMEMIKQMYIEVAEKVYGKTEFENKGMKFNLKDEWVLYHFADIIKEKYMIDVHDTSINELEVKLKESGIKYDKKTLSIERGVDLLWKKIRKEIAGPGFLIGVPVYLETLAKKSKEDNRIVDRFQVILAGSDVGKGFSELNDPVDQAERFSKQQELRDAGDEEAQMSDGDYVEAMEYGMPPAFGFGISERLFSFLEGKTVRESQIFPLMKPLE